MSAAPGGGWLVRRCAEQPVMPWRNGGGSTREVWIEPPGATVSGGFRWRLSVATIGADGPFSVFPGIDRCLWLLAGELRLDVGGVPLRLTAGQRFAFAGELPIAARVVTGPCQDLNLMVERRSTRGVGVVHELAAGAALPVVAGVTTRIVLVLAGALQGAAGTLAPGDAAGTTVATPAPWCAGPDGARCLVAGFAPFSAD